MENIAGGVPLRDETGKLAKVGMKVEPPSTSKIASGLEQAFVKKARERWRSVF